MTKCPVMHGARKLAHAGRKIHIGTMRKLWKFGRSRSPKQQRRRRSHAARTLETKIPPDKEPSAASPQMGVLTTRKCLTRRLPPETPMQCPSRRKNCPSPGNRRAPGASARKRRVSAQPNTGRTLWRRWSGYPPPKFGVETKMHWYKTNSANPLMAEGLSKGRLQRDPRPVSPSPQQLHCAGISRTEPVG